MNPKSEREKEATKLKEIISRKVKTSVQKLNYIYEIQDQEFWYLELAKLKKADIDNANTDFIKRIGDNFIDLGLSLGNFFTKNTELTVELYKFNETLTRLLNNNSAANGYRTIFEETQSTTSSISTRTFHPSSFQGFIPNQELVSKLDSNLAIKSLVKTLIAKLETISERIGSSIKPITLVETKLIDDVLIKNISHRILEPYHTLLLLRVQSHFSELL